MVDPRIARTRQSLQEALLDLARERDLDEISIGDIAQRAGVNRSSFYQHYADKETLLADAIDAAAEHAGADLPSPDEVTAEPPDVLLRYLRHVDANAAVYRRVFGPRGSAVATARLHARVQAIARQGIDDSTIEAFSGIPSDVLAAGLAGSVLAVLEVWLNREPRPPIEVAAGWVWQVLLGPLLREDRR